jgi:hypothetical protein
MPHTIESTINLSERDLARGAVDLYAEDLTTAPPLLPNSTILQKAVSVVKEAAPSIVETIVSHLTPAVPHHPGNSNLGFGGPPQRIETHEVMVSPPVETVVIVAVPVNDTIPVPPPTAATVIFDWLFICNLSSNFDG